MKRPANWTILILAAALLTTVALAEPPNGRGPKGGPGGGMRGMHGMPGLGAIADELGLDEAQRDRIHEIAAARRDALRPLMESARAARGTVAEATHADILDEQAIRTAVMAAAEIEADLAVERARMLQEMHAVLTPEQLAQAKELMQARTAREGERRGRGRRRGPGY